MPYMDFFLGVGFPVSISCIHTAYIGEDSSILRYLNYFDDLYRGHHITNPNNALTGIP